MEGENHKRINLQQQIIMKKNLKELADMLAEKLDNRTYSEETREVVEYRNTGLTPSIEVRPAHGTTIFHTNDICEFAKFFELSNYVTVRFEDGSVKLVWMMYAM